MRRTLRLLATTALATGLVVGASGTAFAQKTTVKEASGDVVRFADEEDLEGTSVEDAESRASGVDIKSFTADHTKTRLKVSAKFRVLKDDTFVTFAFRLNGQSEPTRFLVNVDEEEAVVYRSNGQDVCDVPVTVTTGANGTISASINRKCLGYPSKLRVAVAADRYVNEAESDETYGDISGTYDKITWTKSLTRG